LHNNLQAQQLVMLLQWKRYSQV